MWNFSSETPSQAKHAGFQVSIPLEASSGFVGGVAHEICRRAQAAFRRRPAEALPGAVGTTGEGWETGAGSGAGLGKSWVSRGWKVRKADDETGCW